MSLLLGEEGTWMESTRSFQMQTNLQTVQTTLKTKLQKLMLTQHLASNPNANQEGRRERFLWVLRDGRYKLHGHIGWRTCIFLPLQSRGSLRSHIRNCWSSPRVRITQIVGFKWMKERQLFSSTSDSAVCWVVRSCDCQWTHSSSLWFAAGARSNTYIMLSKQQNHWQVRRRTGSLHLPLQSLDSTFTGFNAADHMNNTLHPIRSPLVWEFPRTAAGRKYAPSCTIILNSKHIPYYSTRLKQMIE